MSLVATLIFNPANPALDSTVVDGARAILPSPGAARWLFDEVAVDIPFESSEDIRAIEARLREARGDLPIDIVVQPRALRRKKLLLADMDSTMIGQECIDELADYVGLKAHVAGITERAMRGEIEFEPALRERVALLKGLPVSVIDEVLKQRITLTPGSRELIATMRAHGAYSCLISGGFTLFTNAVAAMIGFQENRANELIVQDGKPAGGGQGATPGPRHQTRHPGRTDGILRPRRHRHACRRRRRQRSRHDPASRPGRRLPRTTRRRRRCCSADRPRRSDGVTLCAGISAGRFCGGVTAQDRQRRAPPAAALPPTAPISPADGDFVLCSAA